MVGSPARQPRIPLISTMTPFPPSGESVAADALRAIRHSAKQIIAGIKVGERPWMPDAEREKLEDSIGRARVYVEFGSGGSTVFAARRARHVFTVENDRRFLMAVKKAVGSGPAVFHPIFVNVGPVQQIGIPVFAKPSPARLARWRRYPRAPWAELLRERLTPDTILVDGRFRVACVLESVLQLPEASDCEILLDDADGSRPYLEIEPFIRDVQRHGRLMSFRPAAKLDREECRRTLERYYADWR